MACVVDQSEGRGPPSLPFGPSGSSAVMGMICVNEFDTSADADAGVPRCVASWSHTQDQVVYALYVLAGLLALSLVWMTLSRRQRRSLRAGEIGFSLSYRRWARTSRAAAIINRPLQMIVSLLIMGITASRCSSYEVSSSRYHLVTALYAIAFVDDGVRFLASRYKVLYCVSPLTLLEICMLASHYEVGYGPTKIVDGMSTRSWLDFSIMRPVFMLRSYLEMERHVPKSTKGWMMVRLGIKIFLMIAVGASIMFFLETLGEMPLFSDNGFAHLYSCSSDGSVTSTKSSDCSTETWSVMFSFYFTVVTLGTVGYGDNAPKTVLSRLLAIMFIVMGIILFSIEIENLINVYKLRQIGNPPYKPKPEAKHVVIMGNPSFSQLSAILRELFHEDHASDSDTDRLHAVVLGTNKSKFTNGLIAKLKADPIFTARVTYVAGDGTRTEDLDRALARDCEGVFVFPDKLSNDPSNEDAMNIMRVLSAKRYCGPHIRFLVMVLRGESARHMLAAGVHRDDIVCENIIKMGALARSSVSHGTSTMLANLASSLSIDSKVDPDTAKNRFLALKIKDKLERSNLRFSSLAEGNPIGNDGVELKSWLKEYYEGAAKEMYLIHLSKKYAGMTFAQTSLKIFNETSGKIVLIAVEVLFAGDDTNGAQNNAESRVLLNPGDSLIMAEWMQCYVLADDLAHVFDCGLCPEELMGSESFPPPTVLEQWSNPMTGTFIDTHPEGSENDELCGDELKTPQGSYAAAGTPNFASGLKLASSSSSNHSRFSADSSLQRLALTTASNRRIVGGNPYDNSINAYDQRGNRATSVSSPDESDTLVPPPLEVLLNPHHIVVCSFLGEESLASIQWLILPLRSAYNAFQPPITILDTAEPSPAFVQVLSAFADVYYVQGSPLVYSDLQRAGAKAAAAVIVLGKRTQSTIMSTSAMDADLETSIVDAEAIFSTMLVELKMDFTKIFTITELSDEANSKFMGLSFQLSSLHLSSMQSVMQGGSVSASASRRSGHLTFWDYILMNDAPQQKSEKAIFGLPLFMSGRLLHPEFCENMVIQTFYNPSIHKIIRQLVGGPHCTGVIHTFAVPKALRLCSTYGDVFYTFASSAYAGICLGVYRNSVQVLGNGQRVNLPIVITTPDRDLEILGDDKLFVLIGANTLDRAACRIRDVYRCYKRSSRHPRPTAFPVRPSMGFGRNSVRRSDRPFSGQSSLLQATARDSATQRYFV